MYFQGSGSARYRASNSASDIRAMSALPERRFAEAGDQRIESVLEQEDFEVAPGAVECAGTGERPRPARARRLVEQSATSVEDRHSRFYGDIGQRIIGRVHCTGPP